MTLFVDPRAGSRNLVRPLKELGIVVESAAQIAADVEALGYGPDGPFLWGLEHKSAVTGDIFESLQDGRLTGTQLPRMAEHYDRLYLLIEGPLRVAADGVLEVSPKPGEWRSVGGNCGRGQGWIAETFYQRIESLSEFFGVRVIFAHNVKESARRISALYHWWGRQYASHSSWKQWDRSHGKTGVTSARSKLVTHNPLGLVSSVTSDLPLAVRWAREIDGIGQEQAAQVATHFGNSGLAMALADEDEWRRMKTFQRFKTKAGIRKIQFGKERARKIVAQIRNEPKD